MRDSFSENTPDFSAKILAQLSEDAQAHIPCAYIKMDLTDFVTFSDSPDGFEAHLSQCLPCQSQVGQLQELDRLLQLYRTRLPSRIESPDFSATVILSLEQDLENLEAESDSPSEDVEVRFQAALASYCDRLGQTAPDFWPTLSAQLQHPAQHSPQKKPLRLYPGPKLWASLAAGLVLVLMSVALLAPITPKNLAEKVDQSALEQALIADQQDKITSPSETSVSVLYRTPEAYLFAKESDILPEEDFNLLQPQQLAGK
jgi:hypothetical protein